MLVVTGIAQSGCWGCFDEFNRINIEVLSVVAQQILAILLALSLSQKRFLFEGFDIKLDGNCGIFITMNPGQVSSSSEFTKVSTRVLIGYSLTYIMGNIMLLIGYSLQARYMSPYS